MKLKLGNHQPVSQSYIKSHLLLDTYNTTGLLAAHFTKIRSKITFLQSNFSTKHFGNAFKNMPFYMDTNCFIFYPLHQSQVVQRQLDCGILKIHCPDSVRKLLLLLVLTLTRDLILKFVSVALLYICEHLYMPYIVC